MLYLAKVNSPSAYNGNTSIPTDRNLNHYAYFGSCFNKSQLKHCLPDGESNPGLPRDRRGYLPLYYRGLTHAGGFTELVDFAISTNEMNEDCFWSGSCDFGDV